MANRLSDGHWSNSQFSEYRNEARRLPCRECCRYRMNPSSCAGADEAFAALMRSKVDAARSKWASDRSQACRQLRLLACEKELSLALQALNDPIQRQPSLGERAQPESHMCFDPGTVGSSSKQPDALELGDTVAALQAACTALQDEIDRASRTQRCGYRLLQLYVVEVSTLQDGHSCPDSPEGGWRRSQATQWLRSREERRERCRHAAALTAAERVLQAYQVWHSAGCLSTKLSARASSLICSHAISRSYVDSLTLHPALH